MDLEEVDEEARILLVVTVGLCGLFTVFSYLGDSVAIVYIYFGWCVYVTVWSLRFYNRARRRGS